MRARFRGIVALAALALLPLTSCSYDTKFDGETLHRGLATDPESLDPQKARSVQAADVLRDIGEGLVGHTPDGAIEPGAAAGWSVSDDGLVYTFRLRDGLAWSDGQPLTAAHFAAGLRRLVDPQVAAFYAWMLSGVDNADAIVAGDLPVEALGVDAVDPATLVITLERPLPYLLSLLTHPSTYPVPPGAGDGMRASNGAYRLVEWRPGSLISLEKNPSYHAAADTRIRRVMYHVLTEELSELNRYRAGELHITNNVPPEQFEQVRDAYPEELRVAPYLGVYFYGFNLTRPPFKDNVALRAALSAAIDRETLVGKITRRGEKPAWSFVPPGTQNYTPPVLDFRHLDQDERYRLARRLYSEAGYGPDNPLRIELRYNTSDTQRRIAVAVQSMWRDVLGVETTLVSEEFQVLLATIRERTRTEVFRGSWIGDYDDANTFLALMTSGSSSNMPGYASDEFDALMDKAAAQIDLDRRRLFLEEAERILLGDHAVVPLYFYVSKHLVHPDVRGWQDNVLDYHYSRHLSLSTAD